MRRSLLACVVLLAGCVSDLDEDSASTSSEISLSATEIRFAAFIPCGAVYAPLHGYFAGDNRLFDYAEAPKRSRVYMQVKLDPNSTSPTTTIQKIGTTHEYAASSITGAGRGACYNITAAPVIVDSATASDQKVRSRVSHPSPTTTQIHMEMAAANPLVMGAPDIDAAVDIFIDYKIVNGKKIPDRYRWKGWHDGFPAYELYVNGSPIRVYDPIAAGRGPGSLIPGNSVSFQGNESAATL